MRVQRLSLLRRLTAPSHMPLARTSPNHSHPTHPPPPMPLMPPLPRPPNTTCNTHTCTCKLHAGTVCSLKWHYQFTCWT